MASQPEWLTRLFAIAPNHPKALLPRPIPLVVLAIMGITACTARTETLTQPQPQSSSEIKTELPADAPVSAPQKESAVTPDKPDNSNVATAPAITNNSATSTPAINAAECQAASTQTAMNQCAQAAYAEAEAKLNQVYQSVKGVQADDGEQSLGNAEVAWINFRDLDCAFERDQFKGGSIASMVYSNCLTERTQIRTAELQRPELPQISYQTADAQLNQTYQSLVDTLAANRRSALTEAQVAWIEYRDRNCAFEVLYSPIVIEETQCLARMSAVRLAQLQAALEQSSL